MIGLNLFFKLSIPKLSSLPIHSVAINPKVKSIVVFIPLNAGIENNDIENISEI